MFNGLQIVTQRTPEVIALKMHCPQMTGDCSAHASALLSVLGLATPALACDF